MSEPKNNAPEEEESIEIEIEIDFDDLEESEESNAVAEEPEVANKPETKEEPEVANEPEVADKPEVAEEQEVADNPEEVEEPAVAEEPEVEGIDDIAAAIAASIGELSPEVEEVPSEANQDLSSPVAPRLTEPSTIKSADKLNFRLVGIKTWKVKVKIGLVYDFSDIKTLHKYIKDGRVTNEDTISHNGKEWTTIGDIPDLEAHFIKIYLEAEKISPPQVASTLVTSSDNMESSLTSDIMAQITQESVSAVESELTSGPDFVDPFVELKKKKRSRIKQRDGIRSMHSEAKNAKNSTVNRKRAILASLAAISLYLLLAKSETPVSATQAIEAQISAADAAAVQNEAEASTSRAAQVAAINERLQAIAAETEAENVASEDVEEVRRYVQPNAPTEQQDEATTTTQEPNQDSPPATQLVSRGTPASRARTAYMNQDWSTAQEAYTQAFNSTRDPQMILGIGKSLFRLGDHRGAEERLLAADQAGTMDQEGLRMLAQIYIDRGDPMGANTYQQRLR
jgi:hypothetical protein